MEVWSQLQVINLFRCCSKLGRFLLQEFIILVRERVSSFEYSLYKITELNAMKFAIDTGGRQQLGIHWEIQLEIIINP